MPVRYLCFFVTQARWRLFLNLSESHIHLPETKHRDSCKSPRSCPGFYISSKSPLSCQNLTASAVFLHILLTAANFLSMGFLRTIARLSEPAGSSSEAPAYIQSQSLLPRHSTVPTPKASPAQDSWGNRESAAKSSYHH